MLYVGNFSYIDATDENENYCLIPCLVEAQNLDDALDKFALKLVELHNDSGLINGSDRIYLDSLLELTANGETPVVLNWQKITTTDEGLCSISSALPEADEVDGAAYSFVDDHADELETEFETPDIEKLDELEDVEEEPFLDFTLDNELDN